MIHERIPLPSETCFWERLREIACRVAYAYVSNPTEAEDLAHDVMYNLCRLKKRCEKQMMSDLITFASFAKVAATAARNLALNRLRDDKKRRTTPLDFPTVINLTENIESKIFCQQLIAYWIKRKNPSPARIEIIIMLAEGFRLKDISDILCVDYSKAYRIKQEFLKVSAEIKDK